MESRHKLEIKRRNNIDNELSSGHDPLRKLIFTEKKVAEHGDKISLLETLVGQNNWEIKYLLGHISPLFHSIGTLFKYVVVLEKALKKHKAECHCSSRLKDCLDFSTEDYPEGSTFLENRMKNLDLPYFANCYSKGFEEYKDAKPVDSQDKYYFRSLSDTIQKDGILANDIQHVEENIDSVLPRIRSLENELAEIRKERSIAKPFGINRFTDNEINRRFENMDKNCEDVQNRMIVYIDGISDEMKDLKRRNKEQLERQMNKINRKLDSYECAVEDVTKMINILDSKIECINKEMQPLRTSAVSDKEKFSISDIEMKQEIKNLSSKYENLKAKLIEYITKENDTAVTNGRDRVPGKEESSEIKPIDQRRTQSQHATVTANDLKIVQNKFCLDLERLEKALKKNENKALEFQTKLSDVAKDVKEFKTRMSSDNRLSDQIRELREANARMQTQLISLDNVARDRSANQNELRTLTAVIDDMESKQYDFKSDLENVKRILRQMEDDVSANYLKMLIMDKKVEDFKVNEMTKGLANVHQQWTELDSKIVSRFDLLANELDSTKRNCNAARSECLTETKVQQDTENVSKLESAVSTLMLEMDHLRQSVAELTAKRSSHEKDAFEVERETTIQESPITVQQQMADHSPAEWSRLAVVEDAIKSVHEKIDDFRNDRQERDREIQNRLTQIDDARNNMDVRMRNLENVFKNNEIPIANSVIDESPGSSANYFSNAILSISRKQDKYDEELIELGNKFEGMRQSQSHGTDIEDAFHNVPYQISLLEKSLISMEVEIKQLHEKFGKENLKGDLENLHGVLNSVIESVNALANDVIKKDQAELRKDLEVVRMMVFKSAESSEAGRLELEGKISKQLSDLQENDLQMGKRIERLIDAMNGRESETDDIERISRSVDKSLQHFSPHKKQLANSDLAITVDEDVDKINTRISHSSPPPALPNLDLNCYLNVAIQSLSSSPLFINGITKLALEYPSLDRLSTLSDILSLMVNKKTVNTLIISTSTIHAWNKTGEQDAFEVMSFIVNQVYNEIRKEQEERGVIQTGFIEEWLKLNLPLRIKMRYHIMCGCGNESVLPIQSDMALHISVVSVNTENSEIQEYIDKHFDIEDVDDHSCPECDGDGATKFAQLSPPLPDTLCIHLQMHFWTGSHMQKSTGLVRISDSIIIRGECVESSSSCNGSDNAVATTVNTKYRLMSVIVHYGDANGGHYFCYKYVSDQWYITNDSDVRRVSEDEVFGCDPYILLYERIPV